MGIKFSRVSAKLKACKIEKLKLRFKKIRTHRERLKGKGGT